MWSKKAKKFKRNLLKLPYKLYRYFFEGGYSKINSFVTFEKLRETQKLGHHYYTIWRRLRSPTSKISTKIRVLNINCEHRVSSLFLVTRSIWLNANLINIYFSISLFQVVFALDLHFISAPKPDMKNWTNIWRRRCSEHLCTSWHWVSNYWDWDQLGNFCLR